MSTEANYLDKPASYRPMNCDSLCETEYVEWSSTPYTFVWIIRNFSYRKAWGYGNSPLVSTSFDIPIPNNTKFTTSWRLQLDRDGDFLSLHVNNCNEFEVKAEYKFSILDSNQERQNVIHSEGEAVFESSSSSTSGTRKFVDIQTLRGNLLPFDSLHIACDLTVKGAQLTTEGKKSNFAEDTDLMRNLRQKISIDLPQKLLILSNLCTGGDGLDLLTQAYGQISEDLTTKLGENLCRTLDSDNCIRFLLLADFYSLDLLRERSLEIAAENLSDLMKTSKWKENLSKFPLLKDEIIEKALSLKDISVDENKADVDEKKRNAFS